MRKLYILAGAAVGYVLGTRAGRERYDQIMDQASRLWGDPRVQEKVEEAKQQAPGMAEKVTDAARSAGTSVKDKVGGNGDDDGGDGGSFSRATADYTNETGTYDSQTGPQVDTSSFGPGGERLP